MRHGCHAILAVFAAAALGAAAASLDECARPPPIPLSLDAAQRRLADCNRDVAAARTALVAAAADLRIADERPNPNLSIGTSNVNPHAGLGAGSLRDKTFDSYLRVEQLFERGGKATLRVSQAQALVEAARADAADQLRTQRLAMRLAYFDLAAAQERARLQREFRRIADASAEASRRRAEAGEVSHAESNRFVLDAARAANDEREAQIERERARLELAKLLGAEAYAASIEVVPSWGGIEAAGKSVGERPDVAAARYRLEAALRARDLARSVAVRDVTLGLEADRWPASDANPQGTGTSYSLSVSIPLNVRHASEGEAARAEADLTAARASLERAQALSAAELQLADAEWRAALQQRARMEAEVGPVAREVAKAAEFAYERGATGVLDLLDARRSLKSVELDEVQVRADAAKAWARREAAHERIEP